LPAFDGLLPLRDNTMVQDLLFELVNWHALAKLQMHTSVTLDIWCAATRHMYTAMRSFARTTCMWYTTHELPRESEARVRRTTKPLKATKSKHKRAIPRGDSKVIKFNVWNTYKFHCLGDHPDYVERSGTNDNHSTQVVSLVSSEIHSNN
ncbi:hypothetical protein BD413DRAFT_488656, partial [Trametes elegans]